MSEQKYRTLEGGFAADGLRFGVVVSRFNSFITERLLEGAIDGVVRHGGSAGAIDVAWVPGSVESPLTAKVMAESGRYDAVICLGAIIRGDTDHYDHVAAQSAAGIASAGRESGVPVIFGILTCDTVEQAINRAGAKAGNKGFESAMAAIEMANLLKHVRALG